MSIIKKKFRNLAIIILLHFALNACSNNSDVANNEVTICMSKGSYAYHSKTCRGVNACKSELKKVSIEEAKQMGRRECGYCY